MLRVLVHPSANSRSTTARIFSYQFVHISSTEVGSSEVSCIRDTSSLHLMQLPIPAIWELEVLKQGLQDCMEVALVASADVPLIVAAPRFDALRRFREARMHDSILRKQSHGHAVGERQSRGRGCEGKPLCNLPCHIAWQPVPKHLKRVSTWTTPNNCSRKYVQEGLVFIKVLDPWFLQC
ncbi:unnamed protein product [Urochloa humidicola]